MQTSEARKQYTKIGRGLFVFSLVMMAISFFSVLLLKNVFNRVDYSYNDITIWAIDIFAQYIVGFPLFYLLVRKGIKEEKEKTKISLKQFFIYFLECMGLMYVGNIIGNLLSLALSSGTAVNPVVEMVSSSNVIIRVIVAIVIAPIIEETIFRKLIIDRTAKYGGKVAIIFSAFSFAIFHMNLYQFFYAFALGLMFGYIYYKTRNIKYTIIMHLIINLLGGVVAPYVLSLSLDILSNISESFDIVNIYSAYFISLFVIIYSLLNITASIVGIVYFIKNIKKVEFDETENDIPKGKVFKTAYLNGYYIAFFVLCLTFIIWALI